MATTTSPLPPYPSLSSVKSLSPSQQSTLTQSISTSLLQTLALPPTKRDTPATRAFVSSYVRECALHALEALIWEVEDKSSTVDRVIRKRALLLAEKLAASSPGLDWQTIIDLSIVYGRSHTGRVKNLIISAISTTPAILSPELINAFTSLLSPAHSTGLYGLRKTAHCLLSLLQCSPVEVVLLFSSDKALVLSVGSAYDDGLGAISRSYGGLRGHTFEDARSGEIDEWEKVWVETKVSLIDSFHILLDSMFKNISSASGQTLGRESERVFDIIFALLELPSTSSSTPNVSLTPFLNRPLLADYQHSYDLSHTLASALKQTAEEDARVELLESTLRSLEVSSEGRNDRDPGALKLLLRSSGVPPGIDNLGRGKSHAKPKAQQTQVRDAKGKGKSKATPPIEDPDLDIKTSQVLSILSDHDPSHIRLLLTQPNSSVESVVEALLEGTAPSMAELEETRLTKAGADSQPYGDEFEYTKERRNVFDDEVIDLSSVRVGKKRYASVNQCSPFNVLTICVSDIVKMKQQSLKIAHSSNR